MPRDGRRRSAASQLVRSLVAGVSGTSAMTATTWVERQVRAGVGDIPVDYDATSHVATAAATVLRVQPSTRGQERALFLLVHWGYGSAVASLHTALRDAGLSRTQAAAAFYVACQAMAFTLFPLLGGTPPPWRWRRDVLASSLGQHLVYVTAVAVADRYAEQRTHVARTGG